MTVYFSSETMDSKGNRFFSAERTVNCKFYTQQKYSSGMNEKNPSEKYPSEQRELKEYVTNRPTFKAQMTIK